jgi:glycosyltransferase involved in cell wall biosynthesis
MDNKKYRSIFISYDGLTDPLGQSQILPYIIGLSGLGYEFTILSCEKKDRYEQKRGIIEDICKANRINWQPLFFHASPPLLSKFYDLYNLKRAARRLYRQYRFDIIHCRSYLSAEIGMELKERFGCKYLFDMRGFWVDERVDGGLWNLKNSFYRAAYRYYKKKEGKLIGAADHIISLTEAGKKEIQTWKDYRASTPITVIPCSADLDLFTISQPAHKEDARIALAIDQHAFVLSYLGSLGTWYLLDEMLFLFKSIKERHRTAVFLILTPDDPELVLGKAVSLGLAKEDLIIRFAERKQVPFLIKASDVSVSFIKPAYSKIASSPTKIGELLAMGIPVICNDIGDVKKIVEQSGGGLMIDNFHSEAFSKVVDALPTLMSLDKRQIRSNIYDYYALTKAVTIYGNVYHSLTAH